MNIKSIQNLVSEAMNEIKTIDADQAYEMLKDSSCNLIDVREVNELDAAGRVDGAIHIPRGMLEVYLDPNRYLMDWKVISKTLLLFVYFHQNLPLII